MRSLLAMAAVVSCATSAYAQPASHADSAARAYAEADYRKAADEYALAYAEHPNSDLLYSWAQAERLAGACAKARELYQRFLGGNPPAAHAALARANMMRCTDARAEVEREPVPLEPSRATLPWYKDVWGDSLCAAGIASAAVGVGFWIS